MGTHEHTLDQIWIHINNSTPLKEAADGLQLHDEVAGTAMQATLISTTGSCLRSAASSGGMSKSNFRDRFRHHSCKQLMQAHSCWKQWLPSMHCPIQGIDNRLVNSTSRLPCRKSRTACMTLVIHLSTREKLLGNEWHSVWFYSTSEGASKNKAKRMGLCTGSRAACLSEIGSLSPVILSTSVTSTCFQLCGSLAAARLERQALAKASLSRRWGSCAKINTQTSTSSCSVALCCCILPASGRCRKGYRSK